MKKIIQLGLAIVLVGLMANNYTWAHGGGRHGRVQMERLTNKKAVCRTTTNGLKP